MCSVEGTLGRLAKVSSLAALTLRLDELDLFALEERDFAGRDDGRSGLATGWRERFESPLGGHEALLDESRRWRERRVGQVAEDTRLATAQDDVEMLADWEPTRAARPSCDENMIVQECTAGVQQWPTASSNVIRPFGPAVSHVQTEQTRLSRPCLESLTAPPTPQLPHHHAPFQYPLHAPPDTSLLLPRLVSALVLSLGSHVLLTLH